jgi:hypothetical protein
VVDLLLLKGYVMDFLASVFVGKPLNILMVAAVFFLVYLIVKFLVSSASLHSSPFLVISIVWGVYAAWEWLVITQTPEANIRVDLLVIWPVLAILMFWQFVRVFR